MKRLLEVGDNKGKCLQCGYPMKVIKITPATFKSAKKVKVKCTSNHCEYTEILRSDREIFIENHIDEIPREDNEVDNDEME